MNALLYIIVTSIKNRLRELLHKPLKLVLYAVCIVGMGALMLLPFLTGSQSQQAQTDLIWLKGGFFVLLTMFVIISIKNGLSNGSTLFEMEDVNLLFVSPIKPQSILLYGLVQMAKTAFWAGFFLLFQGSTVGNLFGKGFEAILILFLCFILNTVLMSILSLVIYNLTNGRPARKRLVWVITAACFVPLLAYAGVLFLQSGNLLQAVEALLRSPVFSWFPVSGWAAQAATSLVAGKLATGLLFIGVIAVAGGGLVTYLLLGKVDYYEDVLVATETAFEKKRAVAEGQANLEALSTTKTKVSKTGVGGFGASALLYKHLRESTRASALGLLSVPSLFFIVGAGVLAFLMRGEGGVTMLILQIMVWIQLFLIGTGRGMKELFTHYIYLIPETSFRKIVWSNMEAAAKILLESILIFGVAGVIAGDSPLLVVGGIVVYTLFSLMLLGVNYQSMRWLGTDISAGILIMIYIVAVIVLMAPGVVGAIVVGMAIGETLGMAAGFGVVAVWELLVALGCFALSKGVLHHCDIQVRSK